MRHKRKARATAPGIASARQMVASYGPRALAVSFAMKNTARTKRQRAHWDKVIKTLEARKKNPARRVLLRDVKKAERAYASALAASGPQDQLVQRKEWAWRDLQSAYEKQTGRPLYALRNPIKHGYTVLANGAELATFKTRAHAMQYGRALARAHPTQRVQMRLP